MSSLNSINYNLSSGRRQQRGGRLGQLHLQRRRPAGHHDRPEPDGSRLRLRRPWPPSRRLGPNSGNRRRWGTWNGDAASFRILAASPFPRPRFPVLLGKRLKRGLLNFFRSRLAMKIRFRMKKFKPANRRLRITFFGFVFLTVIVAIRILTTSMFGGPYVKRSNLTPLKEAEYSIMCQFMLINSENLQKVDFILTPDSLYCSCHARFTTTKDGIERLSNSGWTTTATPLDFNADSSSVQQLIEPSVQWGYLPRLPNDTLIVNSAVNAGERAQGIVRPVSGGYLVFLDRQVPPASLPQAIKAIMAAGACTSGFVSQSEIDVRTWESSPTRDEKQDEPTASRPSGLNDHRLKPVGLGGN